MLSENSPELEHTLKSLSTVSAEMKQKGFVADFKIEHDRLKVTGSDHTYTPDQVKIVNFFRFEGPSDPADMTILYVIEAYDGTKGTLAEAFGTYADPDTDAFLQQVDGLHKKNTNTNVTPDQLAHRPPADDAAKVF